MEISGGCSLRLELQLGLILKEDCERCSGECSEGIKLSWGVAKPFGVLIPLQFGAQLVTSPSCSVLAEMVAIGWQVQLLTLSVSTQTSQMLVPRFIFYPNIILSEMPLRLSTSEKAAAEQRISTVSQKLAFLKIETSLTLFIPWRLTGVSVPRDDIQSARTAIWRLLMQILQGFRISLIQFIKHCLAASIPRTLYTQYRSLEVVLTGSTYPLIRHYLRLEPTASNTSSSCLFSKDKSISSLFPYSYDIFLAVFIDLMPFIPDKKISFNQIYFSIMYLYAFYLFLPEVSEVIRNCTSGHRSSPIPTYSRTSNSPPYLYRTASKILRQMGALVIFSVQNYRLSTHGDLLLLKFSSNVLPSMLLQNSPASQYILELARQSLI